MTSADNILKHRLKIRMKHSPAMMAMAVAICVIAARRGEADNAYHHLASGAFTQNWSNTGLITLQDNWSGVPGIIGYRGDGLVSGLDVDPQTVLADSSIVDVNANQTNPSGGFVLGGVTEFEIADPTISIKGSGTANAPYLLLHLNATGVSGVNIAYNLRDVDASLRDTVSQFALQYRIGSSGNFINIPAGYVADATDASAAIKVTPVSVTLPSAVDGQAQVQVRIIATNAYDTDEFVGIDDIVVSVNSAPAAPSGLTATVISETQINLSWTDNSSDETGFKLYRNGTPLSSPIAANTTNFSDAGLTCGTYSYYVAAVNSNGESAPSNAVTVTAKACPIPVGGAVRYIGE